VEKYLVTGNSLLPPDTIGQVFTNIDGAFGTNVTFDGIHTALTGIQAAYRERGFVTVSVNLPQQRLTNATVKVQVTEGRLAAINVTGNRYFSSNNVMRALPSLHPDMFLNSHVFQRELDLANASRDRQIYPVIGPGPEPGTSELTLKVKDRLPLHARLEINNEFTPNTPDLRLNFSAQYDNLWGHEHQIGLQYGSAFEKFKGENDFSVTPFDDPLVANYSAYYRLPLGGYRSVQEEVNANPGSFGYSEATHQFRLPPATGRPELTFYASRSISDTGVQRGSSGIASSSGTATNLAGVVYNPLTITTNSAGDNVTLNEDLGSKLSLPLPQMGKITATLSLGADFKRYRQTSYNTNEVFFVQQNPDVNNQVQTTITPTPQSLGSSSTSLDYLPLNVGLNGSMPDALGTTYINAQANFNVLPFFSRDGDFANAAYTTNAHAHYVTLQLGVDRVQTIYRDWSVKLHADGQWANGALFSNEQYGVGGTAGVRGYTDGEFYGDTGWRVMLEPQTPSVNIGMVDGDQPFWVRVSVFMDYGQAYLLEKAAASASDQARFWGAGLGLTANIGDHWDARLSFAWPLISSPSSPAGDMHIYFGVGAQF
jgi:hemolysin activation/secretion protein